MSVLGQLYEATHAAPLRYNLGLTGKLRPAPALLEK